MCSVTLAVVFLCVWISHDASRLLWASPWVLIMLIYNFSSFLPSPLLVSLPPFSELTDESWLRNPKKAGPGGEEVKKERDHQIRPCLASLCPSPIHPSIYLSTITEYHPPPLPTHHPSWFLSVLSWHVTPECMMCWFIDRLHRHTPAIAEINPSDPVVMRLQVVCLCVLCMCACGCGSGWLSLVTAR